MNDYAIIRIEKIKTRAGLVQRTQHNERTKETPNANEDRLGLNHEYVNVTGQPILALLDARTTAAGVGKPRANATLCVEVLMTGGPEAEVWQRSPATGQNPGQAADMRGSKWEADAVSFARKEWGENLLSLKLHQDEKTPHFQAFVVPIVGAGGGRSGETNPKNLTEQLLDDAPARRSARDLFTPRRLAQLQTYFSDVMEPHGFKRGIPGSRAHHKTMTEMYGLLEKTATDLVPSLAPVRNERFMLESPPRSLFKQEDWRSRIEDQINTALDRVREEANAKLVLAGQVAVAAAGGNEAAERSREWVEKEKQHKTGLEKTVAILRVELDTANDTVRDLSQQLSQAKTDAKEVAKDHAARWDNMVLHAVQGTLPAEAVTRGKEVWQAERARAREAQQRALALPLESEAVYHERMRAAGYQQQFNTAGNPILVNDRTGARFKELVRPDGTEARSLAEQIAQAVQQTARAVQEAERAAQENQRVIQASLDRQRDAAREHELTLHRKTEYAALQAVSYNLSTRDYLTARIRVPSEAVTSVVQQLGANIAIADKKPGEDGLMGINLVYKPQVSHQCTRVSDLLARVASKGGEVYELPEAQAARQQGAASVRSTGLDYGVDRSHEPGIE